MNEELKTYWQYLRDNNADVPDTFESFHKTLQDDISAKKYYDYLKAEGFDAPETFDSFSNTLGLKKKESTGGFTTPSPILDQESQLGSKDFLNQITYKPEEEPVVGTIPVTSLDPSEQRAEKFLADMEQKDYEQLQRDTQSGNIGIKNPFVEELKNAPPAIMPKQYEEANAKAVITRMQEEITGKMEPQGTVTDIAEDLAQIPPSFNKGVLMAASAIPKGVAIISKGIADLAGIDTGKIQDYEGYRLGEFIEEGAKKIGLTAIDERRAGFLNSTVPMAFGQMIGMILTGGPKAGGGPLSKAPGFVKEYGAQMASGALQASVPEYEAAIAAGKDESEAFKVFLMNVPGGASEVWPIANMFGRINKITGGGIVTAIKQMGAQGLEEGMQEGIQQYISNKVASFTYDPKRDLKEGLLEGAGAGFIVGFLMPGIIGAMGKMTPEDKAETQKILDEVLKKGPEQTVTAPSGDLGVKPKVDEKPKEQVGEVVSKPLPKDVQKEGVQVQAEPEKQKEVKPKEKFVWTKQTGRDKTINGEDWVKPISEWWDKSKENIGKVVSKLGIDKDTAGNWLNATEDEPGIVATRAYSSRGKVTGNFTLFTDGTSQFQKEGDDTVIKFDVDGNEIKPVTQDVTPETVEEKPKAPASNSNQGSTQLGNPPQNYVANFGKDNKFKTLGKNEEGDLVGEDSNGVRATLSSKGIIRTQAVGMVPTDKGIEMQVSSPEGDFLTVDEVATKKEKGKSDANKIATDSGFDNASHLINSVKKRTGQEFENVQDIPKEVIAETVKSREGEGKKQIAIFDNGKVGQFVEASNGLIFKITEVLGDRRYKIQDEKGKENIVNSDMFDMYSTDKTFGEKPKITQIKEANPDRILVVKPTPDKPQEPRKSDAKFEKARKSAAELLDLIGPGFGLFLFCQLVAERLYVSAT